MKLAKWIALGLMVPAIAFAAPQSPEQEWGNHRAEKVGVLLNPPRGALAADVQETQKLLQNLVQKLAGEEFDKRGIPWVVSIYANENPNAFAATVIPPAGLHGIPAGTQKIYEIGVTVGLLNLVDSVDQLAFVISHEIAHLLEGHTDESKGESEDEKLRDIAKRWWSSQRYEVVADYLGLQRMAGKFSLAAAVEILNKIAALHPEANAEALSSALTTHHHEGPRIAAAQGTAEYLMRTNRSAQISTSTPLPEFARLRLSTRIKFIEKPSADFEKNKKKLFSWLKASALDEPLSTNSYAIDREWPEKIRILAQGDLPSSKQLAAALIVALRDIDKSRASRDKKVRLYFKLVQILSLLEDRANEKERGHQDQPFWTYLSGPELLNIKLFLSKNSGGKTGWDGSRFLSESLAAEKDDFQRSMFIYRFMSMFLSNSSEIEGRVIADVAQVQPEAWLGLLRDLTTRIAEKENRLEISSLTSYLIRLAQKKDLNKFAPHLRGPLLPVLRGLAIDQLKSVSATTWSRSEIKTGYLKGSFNFSEAASALDKTLKEGKSEIYDLDFLRELRSHFQPLESDFVNWRSEKAVEYFARTKFDASEAKNFSSSFFGSLEHYPLDARSKALIQKNFVNFAHEFANNQVVMASNSDWINEQSAEFFSDLLGDSKLTAEQKSEVFAVFLANTECGYLRGSQKVSEKSLERFYSYFNVIGLDGIIKIMNEPMPSIARFYRADLKDQYGQKSTNKNWLAVMKKLIDEGGLRKKETLDELQTAYAVYLNSRLSILSFVSMDMRRAEPILATIDVKQFAEIISNIRDAFFQGRILRNYWGVKAFDYREARPGLDHDFGLSIRSTELLFSLFDRVDSNITSDKVWIGLFKQIRDFNEVGLEQNAVLKKKIQEKLAARLRNMPLPEAYSLMSDDMVAKTLTNEFISDQVVRFLKASVDLTNPEAIGMKLKGMDEYLKLQKKYPDSYFLIQEKLSEQANLQPGQFRKVFPKEEAQAGSTTEKTGEFSNHIRGLSFIVAKVRQQTAAEQLHFIEYIAGQRDDMPDFVSENSRGAKRQEDKIPLDTLVASARERLQKENSITRIMTVNSFLAGPTSIVADSKGEQFVIDYLLRDIRPENREIAEVMAKAILAAQGKSRSLAFSYILGQPSVPGGDSISKEGQILFNLFNAFGVPGIKFGQYLGFTAQLKQYSEAMESLQDSAKPISYFQMLTLIESRFGHDWPEHYRVIGIIGSGSVNIAVEYEDLKTGRKDVAQIARDQVEVSVLEDFRKFHLALDYVLKDPKYGKKLAFLRGLMGFIRQSVSLEFNKEHVFKMQRFAETLYKTDVNGWHVRTVHAYDYHHMSVFMQKALGRSARKIRKENKEVYNSAMGALNEIEWNVLMGIQAGEDVQPLPLFANPDFHDGQVLIDPTTKTVTILDFGQALPISNEEREIGLEILKVVSESQTIEQNLSVLNGWLNSTGGTLMTAAELQGILASHDRMDIFVRLAAELNLRGYKVPLSAIDWVQAVNRLLALSEKIGGPNMLRLKSLLFSQRFGLNLQNYNYSRRPMSALRSALKSVSSLGLTEVTSFFAPRAASVRCEDLFQHP